MEETLKITKNHHKHLNNPFPSTPRSLPLVQGTLAFNPQTVPPHQIFSIGKEFLSTWRSKNGGSLSISHQSEPNRAIWSTIPGQAFVSAALASISAKYWVFFDQKSSNQIGFHVKIGKPNSHFHRTISSRIYGRRIGWRRYFPKRKAIVTLEFIERFTATIGRLPELPEWIISGAVVGMQGGTDFVRDVWDKLQAYDVPISAFWLQVIPFLKYERSEELLLRWMELNAFTTVFRTHEEASRKGLPVCRHLFLHYPHDEYVHNLSYEQFLVGEEILVVPFVKELNAFEMKNGACLA